MRRLMLTVLLLTSIPAAADLRRQIESSDGWVGYSVPIAGRHTICSWDDWSSHSTVGGRDIGPSSALFVLYQVTGGKIEAVRLSSPECGDSGRAIRWLQGVDPRESARLLRSLIDGGDSQLAKKAVTAFALHQGTVDELIDIARNHRLSKARSAALFWVSQAAGERAASVLKDAVDNDPEEDVKTKAVFGIAQLPDDRSIPLLVELIRTNRSRAVRKKAAFWLGQKNEPRALAALEDILR